MLDGERERFWRDVREMQEKDAQAEGRAEYESWKARWAAWDAVKRLVGVE